MNPANSMDDQAIADQLTLREIHGLLNAQEWDGETLVRIAEVIGAAGFYVAEINEISNREITEGHGPCACRECILREALKEKKNPK